MWLPSADAVLYTLGSVLGLLLTRWLDERSHRKLETKLDGVIIRNGETLKKLLGEKGAER